MLRALWLFAAVAVSSGLEDNWYVVQMGQDGKVVGRMHTSVTLLEGAYQSTESLEVVLQRGTERSAMFIETEVIEDTEGKVRMQRLAHQMGATMTTSVRYLWRDDGTVSVTSSSGRGAVPIERLEAAPNNSAIRGRYYSEQTFKRAAAAGQTMVQLLTLRPEFGLEEVRMTRTLQETGLVPLDSCGAAAASGEAVPTVSASTWATVIEGVPMNMTELFSLVSTEPEAEASNAVRSLSAMTLLRSDMESPFGPLICTLCVGDAAATSLAASAADQVLASASPLPEIVYSVAVPLPGAVRGMGWPGAARVVYKVSHAAGMPIKLPGAGYQRVRRKKRSLAPTGDGEAAEAARATFEHARQREAQVVVDVSSVPKEASAADIASEEYRQPTAMLDSADAEIIALAQRITSTLPEGAPLLERARALRHATRHHITHSTLATGFASASETVRSREGDCTEHAMLLAALLRADAIPSRVCTGVVYSEGGQVQVAADAAAADGRMGMDIGHEPGVAASLVWHMWSQALIDGRWYDLDATLDVPFHGGHILTSTSSMVDILSLRSSELEMMKLIGALDVSVLEVSNSAGY